MLYKVSFSTGVVRPGLYRTGKVLLGWFRRDGFYRRMVDTKMGAYVGTGLRAVLRREMNGSLRWK